MNGFFPPPQRRYNTDGSVNMQQQQYGVPGQQQQEENGGNNGGMMVDMGQMGMTSIPGAQSLADIVNQNSKDPFRRRSMPVQHNFNQVPNQVRGNTQNDLDDSMRRASMVDRCLVL